MSGSIFEPWKGGRVDKGEGTNEGKKQQQKNACKIESFFFVWHFSEVCVWSHVFVWRTCIVRALKCSTEWAGSSTAWAFYLPTQHWPRAGYALFVPPAPCLSANWNSSLTSQHASGKTRIRIWPTWVLTRVLPSFWVSFLLNAAKRPKRT